MVSPSAICICIVVFRPDISSDELLALRQLKAVYRDRYAFVLLVRDDVTDISVYTGILGECVIRSIRYSRLSSVRAYNDYCLTSDFYDNFSGYKYVMLAQLDGWVFYDALCWWACRGYDYVGGPWFFGDRYTFNHVQGRRVGGNGGMSLRNVLHCQHFVSDIAARGVGGWEDRVMSLGGLRSSYGDAYPLAYPDYCDQARFCWNNPSLDYRGNPYPVLRAITGSDVPMCLHQPFRDVYRRLCIPDEEPDIVLLFRNTDYGDVRIDSAVSDMCRGYSRRLFVAVNDCSSFTGNESVLRLFMGERRFLTIHTTTGVSWYGPYNRFSAVGNFTGPAGVDYCGRHDTICIDRSDTVCSEPATFDGDIPAVDWCGPVRSVLLDSQYSAADDFSFVLAVLRLRYKNSKVVVL